MPDQTVTQIIFRGQVISANLFWCGGQQLLMASVPASLAVALHPTEAEEVVVLDSVASDRVKSPNIETMASFRDRLFTDS